MPSTHLQPSRRGVNVDRLNPQQQMFVQYLLSDPAFNPTQAATKAGYKSASASANHLMHNPVINKAIGKALHDRIERMQLTADDVIQHLTNALYLDPLTIFKPLGGGKWEVRNLDDIPIEVRRCITKVKLRHKKYDDGTEESVFEIETMSKDAALPLAMKHLGISGVDLGNGRNPEHSALREVINALVDRVEGHNNVIDAAFIESKVE